MKIKKLLSLCAAMAVTASTTICVTPPPIANAADNSLVTTGGTLTTTATVADGTAAADVDLLFAGGYSYSSSKNYAVTGADAALSFEQSSNATSNGSKYNAVADSKAFMDGVDETYKTLFGDTTDSTKINPKYTACYFNYIGTSGNYDVSVSINVESLPVGAYTMYWVRQGTTGLSANGISSTVTSGSISDVAVGSAVQLCSESKSVYLVPCTFYVFDTFSGKITFTNSSGWLPDIYSIRLMGGDFKTQSDIIQAKDINRVEHATNYDDYTSVTSDNTTATAIFGENLVNAGTRALSYTSSSDSVYMNVTEAGDYTPYILSANSTNSKLTFTKMSASSGRDISVTYVLSGVGTATKSDNSTSSLCLFWSEDETVTLEEGLYKITISKCSNSTYYSNFMALALVKEDTPDTEKATQYTSNEYTGTDIGYMASHEICDGDKTLQWYVGDNTENVLGSAIDISSIGAGSTVKVGLVITGYDDLSDENKTKIDNAAFGIVIE